MSTLQRVLVALDGSNTADGALGFALDLSREYGSELILCTVVDHEAAIAAASTPDGPLLAFDALLAEYDQTAQTLLNAAAQRATAKGARAKTVLLEGRPAVAIVDCATDSAVDAIVLGTHGKEGLERIVLGSTAEGVLRLTTVPTFVVRLPHHDTGGLPTAAPRTFGRILTAVDESDPSDAAIAFALDLAVSKGSTVVFCHAIESGEFFDKAETFGYNPVPILQAMQEASSQLIDHKAQAARGLGLPVEKVIIEGSAADAIIESAAAQCADLIVVGTHGRRGLRRLFLGSVAEHVIRHSAIPVAVVRVPGARL